MSKPPDRRVSAAFLPRLVIALSFVGLWGTALAEKEGTESSARREQPTWRVEFANDVMFGSDNQFTNGFTVQKHSTLAADLDSTVGVWTFGKWFAKRLLPDQQGLQYRKALVVGQSMTTPSDIEDPNIQLNDTPYFGLLAATGSWIAVDDTRFTGFGVIEIKRVKLTISSKTPAILSGHSFKSINIVRTVINERLEKNEV